MSSRFFHASRPAEHSRVQTRAENSENVFPGYDNLAELDTLRLPANPLAAAWRVIDAGLQFLGKLLSRLELPDAPGRGGREAGGAEQRPNCASAIAFAPVQSAKPVDGPGVRMELPPAPINSAAVETPSLPPAGREAALRYFDDAVLRPHYAPAVPEQVTLGYNPPAAPVLWRNSCGQYAISTVLRNMGFNADYNELCLAMNPDGRATTSRAMADYLEPLVGASCHNNGSLEEIKKELDAGRSAILSVRKEDGESHSVVVSGYRTDSSGKVTHWEILDSAWGAANPEGRFYMAASELLDRWQRPFGAKCPDEQSGQYSCYWIKVGTRLGQRANEALADARTAPAPA